MLLFLLYSKNMYLSECFFFSVKGVYISMYSDCLDINRWYHGKSGYIAIIRLTKGKVKKVAENYTQNFTEPTVGCDCHVSDQLPSVSSKTSSFLAFERTQFYIYELLHDGSSETSQSPSAACPFAIVSFSYMDTKASPVTLGKRGQLQIQNQIYHIDLRSTAVAFIPVQLPSVIKVNQAIHMSVLRSLLPRTVFETSYTEEGKKKFKRIILHIFALPDAESASAEVMKGLFVFPDSRFVRRDTKFREKNCPLSSEILHILPVLSYAEGEAEKTSMDPEDELCEVLTEHMQSYATLINPGFSSSPSRPSRELGMFPDQYDVAEAHRHLYLSPEWNNRTWETFKSYMSKPDSFQLPIAKVSEILASGQEERRQELDDDVYICLSSPEEAQSSPVCMEAEDQSPDEQSLCNIGVSMDIDFPSPEFQIAAIPMSQNIVRDNVITSAKRKVPDEVSTSKHTDFNFSGLSTMAKLRTAEVNSVIDLSDKAKRCLDFPKVTNHQKSTKRKKRRRIYSVVKKKVSSSSVKTHSLKTAVSSVKVEHLNRETQEHSEELHFPQMRSSLKPKWKKLNRRKCRFGTLSSKSYKLRSAVDSDKTEEMKPDVGLVSFQGDSFLEVLPLRKKMERWDLKPVLSECGRILLPFGSVDFSDQVKSMLCTKKDECPEKVSHDVPVTLPDPVTMDKQLGSASETAVAEATSTSTVDDENRQLDHEDILTPPVDYSGRVPLTPNFCSVSPTNDTNNLAKTTETKQLEIFSPVELSPKGKLLLSKLKSVLSRRKRKLDLPTKPQKREDVDQESDFCFKRSKVNSDTETPRGNNATPQSVNVSKMASVDPLFAYCLGLTPKQNLENVQKTKKVDALLRNDSTQKEEHTPLDKQPQISLRPLSIFPRRSRIKTLKSTCTSTDALNLLADLALSNDKVPPQPNQTLERTPKDSVKKCDLSKSLSSADQESVLHTLLRNPAARALQSLESPSKCSLVAENNLVSLISKDHAYSLPPSSLLLDLSGATFQVPPLSGSTRLLNHHQSMYGDGAKTLHPSVSTGDIGEHTKTPENLQKHRRKLKHSRTFVMKEKSIQVTRKWEENYNFNLDSRFTSDAKDKVIIRALHGPWDFSMQDTAEEVRLIFHMWIGLFYSRSTSRFFQVDPTLMQQCSEESGSVDVASGTLSDRTRREPEICSAVDLSGLTETPDLDASKLLDLSKKDNAVLEPESGILDLSVKNFDVKWVSVEQQLNKKVTLVSNKPLKALSALNPAPGLQEKEAFQVWLSKTAETEDKLLHFDHNEAPSSKSDWIFCQSEVMRNLPLEPQSDGAALGTEPVLHESSEDISFKKVGIENEEDTVRTIPQQDALCSPTSVMDKEVNSGEECNVIHTGVGLQEKEICQDGSRGPSPDMTNTYSTGVKESVNKESDIVCNGNYVHEKLPGEESPASLDRTDNREGNMDCCTTAAVKDFKNEDVCVKKDGDQNESWISNADIDGDLRNESLPKLCGGRAQQGYISEDSQVDEQLSLSASMEDSSLGVNPSVSKHESPSFETVSTPSEIAPELKDTASQENFDINNTDCQKVVLPISCESSYDSPTAPCFPQEKDSVESPNKMETSDQSLESNSECEEKNLEQTLLEVQESPSKCEGNNVCEVDEQLTDKTDSKTDETSSFIKLLQPGSKSDETSSFIKLLQSGSKSLNLVLNPTHPPKDVGEVHVVPPEDRVENVVQDQEPIPLISDATKPIAALPDQMSVASNISTEGELSPCKSSLLDETYTPEMFREQFDSRSPTPTIDEKPCDLNFCSSPSRSTVDLIDFEDDQNVTENSTPTDDLPLDKKLQTSTVNTNPNPPVGLCPDIKIRTLRVLRSLNEFTEIPNHQETLADPDFPPHKSFVSGEVLQEEEKTNLSNEGRPYSQRPVMAVKPSKSEESQAHWQSKDIDPKPTSQCKEASGNSVKYLSPNSMIWKETKQFFKEKSDEIDSNHSVCEPSSKTRWLANTISSESDTEEETDTDSLSNSPHQNYRRTMSKLNQGSSSPTSSVRCSKSEESFPELGDQDPKFMEYTANGTAENIIIHITQRDSSDKLLTCHKYDAISDDGRIAGPQSSLKCTVFNSGQKRPYSFLEQLSQRCLQNDITRASMEQECLIFSEQMKNLLKRSKKEPLSQPDTHNSSAACTSPLTISFSRLEEQEDSMEFLDTPLVRQKIQVDMSNSKVQTAFTEERKVIHALSQENSNPMEQPGISAMTAECARLYNARMHDVCSAKKVPPRSKSRKGHQSDPRTDKSNHFDFCDQMKKELDETFRSNLNAVVKKSCKTKYRFFILVTSDDIFFKETKLETEGHTAVQPSEFFLGEDGSSSLLIILRNEDIAEHICKIPHLLKLKMSAGVLFAGIDEPDDVINLTHQELFIRAGFVMFDRAVLEPLSVGNMKKISKILQELSKMGKWKWMLHYRDSRRLKENARLSEEANEKKLLMYWCQDADILDVLPYHECDQMTRDQPDYLACLLRLQVQHVSSRFLVFVTDATTDRAFERNGILTMTLNTFLTKSSTEIFRV
uniref:Protein TASOR-like n=1 Tax=Xiphophorus maculatus TaxID=8083 RepID=A0A3B5QP31_XIPMA